MAEIKLTGLEKVAILLKSLPADVADKVLKQMTPRHAKLIRSEVEKVGKRPDFKEALTKVLDEANEIIDPASRHVEAQQSSAASNESAPMKSKSEAEVRAEAGKAPAKETNVAGHVDINLDGPPEETKSKPEANKAGHSDPLRALAAEPPELLTLALESENARTISLLLNSMDVEVAGQIFKRLSGPKRKEVSICFTEQTAINPDLVGHIANAVSRKCQELRATQQGSPGGGNTGAREKRVAAMLRGLERAERMETLGILEETDAELATRVKGMLYQFEDIMRMDNPSVQKLLSDTDTKSLALAMSGAPQEIHEKLLKNLSKRAQESLKEEVELMGTVQAARAQQARQTIVEAIQRLDQRGELVMVE